MTYGVRRLLAINSGSYSFADIALDSPIHLVAPNNRGKSTLVSALQFLYVDELRAMRFGRRSHEDTKEHYFGNTISYLVFECATATGPQSMLVVGRGKVNGSAFARYVFSGGYEADDFQDSEGRVVSFDILRTRLANRSLTEVRPTDLWEVLGNSTRRARADDNGRESAHLGLLPIKTKDDYRSFREAYVRLLSLSNADAAELRRLLIACHAADVGEIKLDVAADYRDEFERAERTETRLAFLSAVMSQIDEGERLRADLRTNTEALQALTPQHLADATRCQDLLTTMALDIDRVEAAAHAAQLSLSEKRSAIDRHIGSTQTQVTKLTSDLADLDRLHLEWATCSPSMIQTMRDNAEAEHDQISKLRENLRQVGTLNLASMRNSVATLTADVKTQQRSLSNWELRVSAWLLSHGFDPQELTNAFRVLNPAILHLIVGADVSVTDSSRLLGQIKSLSERVKGHEYADENVVVNLTSLGATSAEDFRDPELARQNLRLIQARLDEEQRRLGVAEDVERARLELGARTTEHKRLLDRLSQHDQYRARWGARPELEAQLRQLSTLMSDSELTLANIANEVGKLSQQVRGLADDRALVADLQKHLALARQSCVTEMEQAQVSTPDGTIGPKGSTVSTSLKMTDIRTLAEQCCKAMHELQAKAIAIRTTRNRLKGLQRQVTQASEDFRDQKVYFSDEDADWEELIDGRKAVAELEQTAVQSWETLFTTVSAKLDGLVQGARAIGNAAIRITSAMRRHRVSNLQEVQLVVERQHEACDLLESLTRPDGLFTDRDALVRAKEQLRRWIKDGKVIQLDDLFAVRIRVQSMDGQWTEARSLDDIGSTGTGITAKAMIFIQFVRAVVSDERYQLHFYLDETGQLDDRNLHATTSMAMERGIIPITAEPDIRIEPLAHPTVTVYALGQGLDGRFFIDAKRTLKAAQRFRHTEATEDVSESA
jgi:hypothetical protein